MTCLPWLDTLTTGLPQPSHAAIHIFIDYVPRYGMADMVFLRRSPSTPPSGWLHSDQSGSFLHFTRISQLHPDWLG
ncbi:hypothetical protein TNCV_2513221 [Trichonephila clavipes]|nr:hypothetical protein TNCV_2513221 [Trichonephila clavipes]